jgi:uridine kinase
VSSSVYIVAVAGPSCAGKTHVAERLAKQLRSSVLLIDSYYRDLSSLSLAERACVNFDHPSSVDHDLLIRHVEALNRREGIERPIYDFATHTRAPVTETLRANEFLIIEGLFALYWPQICELADTRVFIDAPDEVCLSRRQRRDVLERGRTAESVFRQFTQTVQPMAARYVRPTSNHAQLRLSGEQPVSRSVDAILEHIRDNCTRRFAASSHDILRQDRPLELPL